MFLPRCIIAGSAAGLPDVLYCDGEEDHACLDASNGSVIWVAPRSDDVFGLEPRDVRDMIKLPDGQPAFWLDGVLVAALEGRVLEIRKPEAPPKNLPWSTRLDRFMAKVPEFTRVAPLDAWHGAQNCTVGEHWVVVLATSGDAHVYAKASDTRVGFDHIALIPGPFYWTPREIDDRRILCVPEDRQCVCVYDVPRKEMTHIHRVPKTEAARGDSCAHVLQPFYVLHGNRLYIATYTSVITCLDL